MIDGEPITADRWIFSLYAHTPTRLRLLSRSRLAVSTAELSFHLVNADGFLNVENGRLEAVAPGDIDGALGRSADENRSNPPRIASAAPSASTLSPRPFAPHRWLRCALPVLCGCRYFPGFELTKDAGAEEKAEFQAGMVVDYLILNQQLLSMEFVTNKCIWGKLTMSR